MAKDALIKLRCSQELKTRITRLADRRQQSVSDYIRTRLIDTTPELREYSEYEDAGRAGLNDPAPPDLAQAASDQEKRKRLGQRSEKRGRGKGRTVGGGATLDPTAESGGAS
jgi:hypothetical protein